MSTQTPDLVKSSPSALRLGLIDWRPTVVLYLLVLVGQFLVNSLVTGIVYLSLGESNGQVYQAQTNSAFVTGVFIFVCAVVNATVGMRSASLSGASRPTLTASTYVTTVLLIFLGSIFWWVLLAAQPLLFFTGTTTYPMGVDSWLFVIVGWIACDGAGRFIGGTGRCVGSLWKRSFALMGAIPLGICAIGAPITWFVLTTVHRVGLLGPMHPAYWLLGLIPLVVCAAGWPLTASGHIRRMA
ncbi:MAG: hypothetical protein D8B55_06385 [Actinomyces sp.]|jgi:hypothetical protein|nr:MAG: hypothetical protein D8B55_07150 [Actinomyces sp.]RKV64640.1 MAG: hypothetical protein D8B55_06385 [Actinomyces sp.]